MFVRDVVRGLWLCFAQLGQDEGRQVSVLLLPVLPWAAGLSLQHDDGQALDDIAPCVNLYGVGTIRDGYELLKKNLVK